MKNLFLILLLLTHLVSYSQYNCTGPSPNSPATSKVNSNELANQNGLITFSLTISTGDTLSVLSDLEIEADSTFVLQSSGSFGSSRM